ncbi:MAG: MetS family NSS transporter small subunit [Dethiobacteria bacterium]
MSAGAWIMLVVGITVFWGGAAYFVSIAMKGKGFD